MYTDGVITNWTTSGGGTSYDRASSVAAAGDGGVVVSLRFGDTATFGGALLGITYGVLSASWEPGREGTFWGLEEFKANIPILIQTVTGKAAGQDGSEFPDEWDDGEP